MKFLIILLFVLNSEAAVLNPSIYFSLNSNYSAISNCTQGAQGRGLVSQLKQDNFTDFKQCQSPFYANNLNKSPNNDDPPIVDQYDPLQRICWSTYLNLITLCSSQTANIDLALDDVRKSPLNCDEETWDFETKCLENKNNSDCRKNEKNIREFPNYCSEACEREKNVCKIFRETVKVLYGLELKGKKIDKKAKPEGEEFISATSGGGDKAEVTTAKAEAKKEVESPEVIEGEKKNQKVGNETDEQQETNLKGFKDPPAPTEKITTIAPEKSEEKTIVTPALVKEDDSETNKEFEEDENHDVVIDDSNRNPEGSMSLKNVDMSEEKSGLFSYFILLLIVGAIFYLVFHNKKKIFAIILEGRRKKPGRRRGSSSSAQYRKLDNNLEEAMADERTGGSMRHVIY